MVFRWTDELSRIRRVAFDSNALIYFVERRPPYDEDVAEVMRRIQEGRMVGIISVITEMELLIKPLEQRSEDTLDDIEMLFRTIPNLMVRPVNREVAWRAAELRAVDRLGPMDAIIAATAIAEGCDAIIGNDSVFAAQMRRLPYLYLGDYI